MIRRLGAVIIFVLLLTALFAPAISPYDPRAYDGPTLSAPDGTFLLGTNDIGQDILSQLLYGTRTSLLVGVTVGAISTVISCGLGLLAGYNRRLDPYIMGLCNIMMAVPHLLIVIIVVAFAGAHVWNVIVVLGVLTWPGYARIIRSQVLSLRERDYVKAARTFGAKQRYILRIHILPSIYPLAVVKFIQTAQSAVVTEASLSFLGLGDVSHISWGTMLHYAFQSNGTFASSAWQWWVVPPTVCMVLLILGIAFLGYDSDNKRRPPRNRAALKERKEGLVDQATQGSDEYLKVHNLKVVYPSDAGTYCPGQRQSRP